MPCALLNPRRTSPVGYVLVWIAVLSFGTSAAPPSAAAESLGIYLPESTPPPPPKVRGKSKVRETYADESTRVEREILVMSDEQQVNHGSYVEYYPTGKKFAEGVYNRGVYDGKWTFWYENGQICKEVVFKEGVPDGSWEVFRADGTLMASKTYKNGRRDGKWKEYYDDGQTPKFEQNYVGGIPDAERITYYPSGKPRQKAMLKDGKFHGTAIEWDEAGRKSAEFSFVDGKLNGPFRRWDAAGKESVIEFDMGKRVNSGPSQ